MPRRRSTQALDLGFDVGAEGGAGQGPSLRHLFAASAARESEMQRATLVELDRLQDNPFQPRLEMADEGLDELAAVMKLQGFQGVLVVRPDPQREGFYQLTAGHRRREAARRAGIKVLPVVTQELTDEEMVVRAITENIQREDLSPLEEGRIYQMMVEEMRYTYRQIAKEVGKSVGYVRNRLRVAESPPDVQAMVQVRPDTLRAVIYLNKIKDAQTRADIIQQLLSGAMTADDVRELIADDGRWTVDDERRVMEGEVEDAFEEQVRRVGSDDVVVVTGELEATGGFVGGDGEPRLVPKGDGSNTLLVLHPELAGVPEGKLAEFFVPRMAQPLAPVDIADTERARGRVRRSKLASVLRTLITYKRLVDITSGIPVEERATLYRIGVLWEELIEMSKQPPTPPSA